MISTWEESAYLGRFRHATRECGACAIGLLLVALVGPSSSALGVLVVSLVLQKASGVPWKTMARSFAVPAGFVFTGALTVAISVQWADGFHLQSTPTQRQMAWDTTYRSLGACSALFFLIYTVPIAHMGVFFRWIRLPSEGVELFYLMYRTIAILSESFQTLVRAQNNRLGNQTLRSRVRGAGQLAAALWIQSQHKALQMEQGLAARGYDGVLCVDTLLPPLKLWRFLLALWVPVIAGFTGWGVQYVTGL